MAGQITSATRKVLRQFPRSLALASMFAWRDFRSRYIGTRVGYVWALLTPILYSLIFVVLREQLQKHGLQVDTAGVHPGVFAFTGVAIFQVWYESVTNQVNHLRQGAGMIRSLRIEPEVFFLASFFVSLLDLAIRMPVIALAMILYNVQPATEFWAAPFFAVMAIVTGNVLGYILALIGSFYQDVSKLLQSISLGVLLGTPVFYSATTNPESTLHWVQVYNPLACTLAAMRDALFGSEPGFYGLAFSWFGGSLLLLLILPGIYRVVAPFAVERL